MPMSAGKANAVLDDIVDGFISLHNADPGDNGANELTGGSYARIAGSGKFPSASSRSVSNNADIQYTDVPADTATHFGVWTLVTGGTFEWGGALTTSRTFTAGDDPKFESGDLTLNLPAS